MSLTVLKRFRFLFLVSLLLLAAGTPALTLAQAPGSGLLKVTDAFKLSAKADGPGKVRLHWRIADNYYLYRGRIHVKALNDTAKLGKLELPDGTKEHDQFLGDVEIYHHELTATLPYQSSEDKAQTLKFAVTYQGCHETDPKICYPPHTQKVALKVPASNASNTTQAASTTSTPPAAPAGNNLAANLLSGGSTAAAPRKAEPLPPKQAFAFSARATGPNEVRLGWSMPKGYYLYRDRTHLKLIDADGATLGDPQWPTGTAHHDEYFGSQIVYFDALKLPVPISRKGDKPRTLTLEATFQGCMENGICYPPMTRKVKLSLPANGTVATASSASGTAVATASVPASGATVVAGGAPPPSPQAGTGEAGTQSLSDVQQLAGSLGGSGRWLALLGFFAGGLALAFTPCVLPMVPILSGLIVGAGKERELATSRALVLSIVYVLASSVVFVIAGVIAGLIGASVQAAFQSPWLLGAFALLFVLLALSMFGFYELKPPAALERRLTRASNRQQGGSLAGVAVMGVLSALIVGPCVAPPLAGAVLYIAQSHDPAFGALALFLLSLGMGIPLIVFGTAAGRWLPRAGAWMKTVQAVFGVIFLALAIWMLSRFLAPLWIMLMTGALAVASAVYLGAFDRITGEVSGWRRLWKAAGLVLLVLGASELVGVAAGSRNLLAPLAGLGGGGTSVASEKPAFQPVQSVAELKRAVADARAQNKPVMLDFYADWCVSCKEMEHFTYSQPQVREAMSQFVLLKADVTANNAEDRALLKHFGLFGPPATIFYGGATDQELTGLRLVGFEKASAFVGRLDKATEG